VKIDLVDDGRDRGVNRSAFPAKRFSCSATFENDEHFLADARANTVNSEQRLTARRVVEVQRLHEQQLRSFKLPMFARRNQRADYSRDLHCRIINRWGSADEAT
jgi:hypothetical protein